MKDANKFESLYEKILSYKDVVSYKHLLQFIKINPGNRSSDDEQLVIELIQEFDQLYGKVNRIKNKFQGIHYSHNYGGKMYIRFGKFPASERSVMGLGGEWSRELGGKTTEEGVSVYGAYPYQGKWQLIPVNAEKALYGSSDFSLSKHKKAILSGDIYLVTGKELPNVGSDGEPLLIDVFPVKKLNVEDIFLAGSRTLADLLFEDYSGYDFKGFRVKDSRLRKLSVLFHLFIEDFESSDLTERLNLTENEANYIFDLWEKSHSGTHLEELSQQELNNLQSFLERYLKQRNKSLVFKGYRPFY